MYIKHSETWQVIPSGLNQIFQNKFTNTISENEIIKMKDEKTITDRDLIIAKFLFQFGFATLEQLFVFLDGQISVNSLKSRLDKLIQYRVINKFMICSSDETRIYSDALVIYCLDLGGKYLLSHYTSEDTLDWVSINNMKSSELISKDLLATEFYLKVKQSCPNKLYSYNVNPTHRIFRKNVSPSFDMGLKIGEETKYFIGEVVRKEDITDNFRKRIEKIETLLITNSWKQYYFDSETPPILLIFAESDEVANEVAKIITNTTSLKNFRLSTDQRIQMPLYEKGAFLKYLPELQALQGVKASTFRP